MQDYLWNQPHSTRSLGRDFRLRRGAGHGLVAAANAAGYPTGVGAAAAGGYGAYGGNGLAAAGRSRSLGAGINRDHYGLSDWDYGGGGGAGGYGTAAGYGTRITDPLLLAEEERRGRHTSNE